MKTVLKPNEDPGFLMRSKCSRTYVRSALFAFIKSRLFICVEYILKNIHQVTRKEYYGKLNFNKVITVIAILGVLGLISVVLMTRRPVPIVLPIAPPAVSPYEHFIAGAGIIEANTDNIQLGTEIPGLVDQVLVDVGQQVKKGTPLFTLDSRQILADIDFRTSQVEQAKASVRQAKAVLKSSKDSFDLVERLDDKRAISQDTYLTRKNTYLVNKEALDSAEKSLKVAQDQLKQDLVLKDLHTIRAPLDGEILQVNVHPGEYAPTGVLATPLILFGNTRELHVRMDVDENDAWRYQRGARAVAYPRGNGNILLKLKFAYLEPYVVPKVNLTGQSTERVDTRVLQPIYKFDQEGIPVYLGQQLDVFIEVLPEKLRYKDSVQTAQLTSSQVKP